MRDRNIWVYPLAGGGFAFWNGKGWGPYAATVASAFNQALLDKWLPPTAFNARGPAVSNMPPIRTRLALEKIYGPC